MDHLWKIKRSDFVKEFGYEVYGVFEKYNSDGTKVKLKVRSTNQDKPEIIDWFDMSDVEKVG